MMEKLKAVKINLKVWNKEIFGRVEQEKIPSKGGGLG